MNRIALVLPLLLAAAACQESNLAPTAGRPAFTVAATAACPAHATVVVSDQTSLETAVAAAQPHDTIALNGMIDLTFAPEVFVTTDNLTFTCATPGSGLRAEPSLVSWLFVVLSRHVTVEHLTLDATNPVSGAVVAFNGVEGPFTGFAEDIRLVGNHILCAGPHLEECLSLRTDAGGLEGALISGNTVEADPDQTAIALIGVNRGRVEGNTIEGSLGGTGDPVEFIAGSIAGRFTGNSVQCGDSCLFADGSPALVVANNQFQSAGSGTGIHLQLGTDGDSVVGNTVITTAPSFVAGLGGIRVRDAANAVVTDNVVRGPWANSLALTDLTRADVERNSAEGAGRFGINTATGASFLPISMTGDTFRANRVSGAGIAGIFVRLACRNSFVGNDLQGNAGNLGLVFDQATGANTYAGNATVVVDNGAFDCDGDGVNDPNIIAGPGMARHGLQLGAAGPDPVRTVHGIVVR